MAISETVVHTSEKLEESYSEIRHSSGLKIYVHPKNFSNTVAMLTVRFGGSDRVVFDSNGESIELPAGIAHFLEHKMFETETGEDAFNIFSQYGANANAFTSNDITSYYFSCTENFSESLDILLEFVFSPNFTPESIEKEKDIIGQEIRAGEDSPQNRIYYELLRLMYFSPAFSDTICGRESDIEHITPELLLLCHSVFYRPDNMMLTVCGNVSPEDVAAAVDRHLKALRVAGDAPTAQVKTEPLDNKGAFSEIHMDVSRPLFAFGVKDDISCLNSREKIKRRLAVNILLDVTFGHSGEFFSENYENGVLTNNFSADYDAFSDHAFVIVNGESDRLEELRSAFAKKIEQLSKEGICERDFLRMKRSAYSDLVTGYDLPDCIAENLIDCALSNTGLFDPHELLSELDHGYVCRVAAELFDPERIATAIVLPIVEEMSSKV